MVDSNMVLTGQTFAYTFYVLAIMLLMGWFAYKVTKNEGSKEIKPSLFYSLVTFLVVLGVSLHIITHETIPWKPLDLNRAEIKADKTFNITVANHKFILPSEKLIINKNDKMLFNLSQDISETNNLIKNDIETFNILLNQYKDWNSQMTDPVFLGLGEDKEYNIKHPNRFKRTN